MFINHLNTAVTLLETFVFNQINVSPLCRTKLIYRVTEAHIEQAIQLLFQLFIYSI